MVTTTTTVVERWRRLWEQPVRGWGIATLQGWREEESPPWDYEELVRHELGFAGSALDLGTGGGEFLRSLDMTFEIRTASADDLQRAEELTVRTNQLNSTGRTYSYEDLVELSTDPAHLLLVAEMRDRFGDYGTIGLALVGVDEQAWHLKLLLMSCRTMSRGVGTILLTHIMREAAVRVPTLRADFVETGRNRMMQVTYAFAGFTEVSRDGAAVVLESDLRSIQAQPDYVRVTVGRATGTG